MGSFYAKDFGVTKMSQAELDDIALNGGYVGSIGWGYATTAEVGMLAGGWTATWINTRGMGNHGTLVLVPTDKRTRAIAREGKVRYFVGCGLGRTQADKLVSARVQYKHELAVALAGILSNEGQRQAMLAHPKTYGAGSGRSQWQYAWGDVFGKGLGLSAPREAALAEMVAAVV